MNHNAWKTSSPTASSTGPTSVPRTSTPSNDEQRNFTSNDLSHPAPSSQSQTRRTVVSSDVGVGNLPLDDHS